MPSPKTSRGYRNFNPGNIDFNPNNKWQGQVGKEPYGNPPRFAVFTDHKWGIRAIAMLLVTYQDRHNLRTVQDIISRWAPSNENDTRAYVNAVAGRIGVSALERIDLHDYAVVAPFVKSIIIHELGGFPYTDAELMEGLRLAGFEKPVPTIRAAAGTPVGAGALNIAGIAALSTAAAPVVQSLAGLPQWTGVALVIAAVAVALILVLAKRRDA